MLKLPKIITKTLSLRLSLMLVCAIALLLIASLAVMFHFSRQALKEEAVRDAEETLEGTVRQIDNVLLSIEQTTGNIAWNLKAHLDEPDCMEAYCRENVKCNPYIVGCAIAFKPYFYSGRELFMTYVHRKDYGMTNDAYTELVTQDTFASRPYTEQVWYTEPMTTGRAGWTDPLKNEDTEDEALITFCLPIYDQSNNSVGVIGVDLCVSLLSQIVLASKPSPNGYVTLLARNGSFIVHPDPEKLKYQTVFTQTEHGTDPSVREAAEAMVEGETGFESFLMNDKKWYVFFEPFRRELSPGRVEGNPGWSIGVVYPDDDIFKEYKLLLYDVLAIAAIGLLLFFVLCRLVTRRALLPLGLLTRSVQRIAAGNYDETIPDTKRMDEIGQLQVNFQQMQEALAVYMDKQEHLSAQLLERGEVLQKAYSQAQEADRMKIAFLHFMTNQMIEPAEIINKNVMQLCNHQNNSPEETGNLADAIRQQSGIIIDVLSRLIKEAGDKSQGKEDIHE